MKKICKKIVSILVLAAMLATLMPIVAPAAESASATLTDAMFVRKDGANFTKVMGGNPLQVDGNINQHRVSFLKFDFSNYSESIERLGNMYLTVYNNNGPDSGLNSGMKVYIMPDDKEAWSVNGSYNTYELASGYDIVSSSVGTLIYQTTNAIAKNGAVTTSDLSAAVMSHLKANPSNKIVTFRLDAVVTDANKAYVLHGLNDGDKAPALKFDVFTDSEYVANLANGVTLPSSATTNIDLDAVVFPDNVDVEWTSSNANVIANDGTVKIPADDTNVTLSLKVSLKSDASVYAIKDYIVNVPANDGSEIFYLWDFEGENGLVDKINGGTFTTTDKAHAVPELYADGSDSVAKVTWLAEDAALVANTKPMLGSASPVFAENSDYRYIVTSLDFKKDKSEKSFTLNYRDNGNKEVATIGIAAQDWRNMVFVADLKKNSDGARNFYTYFKEGNAYTLKVTKQYALAYMDEFRIACNYETLSPNIYIDDLTVKGYKEFYTAINRAADAKAVMNLIDSYNALNLATIPDEYYEASNYDKNITASALVGENFTSDAEVFEALKAAIPEHIGAEVYYKWDFENGNLEDVINNVEFMTGHPNFVPGSVVYTTDPADESNGVAKNIIGVGDNVERLVFTNKLEADYNSGNGIIKNVVYDIKIKSEGEGSSKIGIDDNANIRKNLISNVVNTNNTWKSYRVVVDVLDKTVTTYQYFNNMWNQSEKIESIEKFDFNRISSLNNNKEKSADVYFDDVVIRAYGAVYEEINEVSEENFENVLSQLEKDMLISVPSAFHSISAEERAEVISEVKSRTYTSDAEFEAALVAALPQSNEIVYYNWDFENGTLNDTIKAEPFMMDHPNDTAENRVELATDPIDASNSVAKVDYAASTLERLVFTPDINADFANNIFGYVTFDFRVYAPETTKTSIRISSMPTDHHVYSSELEGGKWHTIRAIADLDSKTVKGYELTDGKWTLVYQESNIEKFDFNRFSIFLGAVEEEQVPVAYFDDFKVTSHVSLYEKVNAATEENIAEVLEYYDSICAINLTDAYDALSADEKAAFASAIKAKTYADSYEVNKEVILYFTDKDFVVFGYDYVDEKLDWVKLIIAKSDITAEAASVVVASYNGNELIDVNFVPYTGSLAGGSDVEVSGLYLDITDATSVKVMLLNGFEKLTPLAASEILK